MHRGLVTNDTDKNIFEPKIPASGSSYPAGRQDARREIGKEEEKAEEKFEELVKQSDNVLFETESIFPLDLFPTKLVITIHKVDVIYNSFLNRKIQPVYIQNISDVLINNGLFFSSLELIDIGFTNHTLVVDNLWNKDALEAMKIIQGLVVSSKQEIDLAKVNVPNFVEKVKGLGTPGGTY